MCLYHLYLMLFCIIDFVCHFAIWFQFVQSVFVLFTFFLFIFYYYESIFLVSGLLVVILHCIILMVILTQTSVCILLIFSLSQSVLHGRHNISHNSIVQFSPLDLCAFASCLRICDKPYIMFLFPSKQPIIF